MEEPSWSVEYYVDARGKAPVLEFIRSLAPVEQAVVLRVIDLLQEFGLALKRPHAAYIEKDLWELRAGQGRIFYFACTGRRFVLLHGYRKKRNKAPRKEIETARSRREEFLRSEIDGNQKDPT